MTSGFMAMGKAEYGTSLVLVDRTKRGANIGGTGSCPSAALEKGLLPLALLAIEARVEERFPKRKRLPHYPAFDRSDSPVIHFVTVARKIVGPSSRRLMRIASCWRRGRLQILSK
jgi:hypothetical protein